MMHSMSTSSIAGTRRAIPALLLLGALTACADQSLSTLPAEEERPSLSRSASGADARYDISTLAIPGALASGANGINARGDIVGFFRDASGTHGFLLRDGEVTAIDYPGAGITEARGIAPNGDIIGSFRLPGAPSVRVHGFLLTASGEFHRADHPGSLHTIPQRILPDGTVLGCRHNNDTMASMIGVEMGRHGLGETDAFASMHNGATPDRRRIVGLYTNMMVTPQRGEGYIIDDGEFKPFLVPGSSSTAAWDVNPRGDVVGVFSDARGVHGFVLIDDVEYVTIDVPGATATRVFGINARGDLVGTYARSGTTFAFVARRMR